MTNIMATMAVAALFAASAQAQLKLTVCVENSEVINGQTLARSEGVAGQILGKAGVKIHWQKGRAGRDAILMKIAAGTPGNNHHGALASTQMNDDVHITVFYDRIKNLYAPDLAPSLLAHVMAHEIAHVLQGVNRHSTEGVMKAYWSKHDIAQMASKPLAFTAEDIDLMQSRARTGARVASVFRPSPLASPVE